MCLIREKFYLQSLFRTGCTHLNENEVLLKKKLKWDIFVIYKITKKDYYLRLLTCTALIKRLYVAVCSSALN